MKHSLLLFALLAAAPAFSAPISINGSTYAVDTIVPKYSVGPGTTYAYYRLPVRPLEIHVLEIDLSNPYIHVEMCNGGQAAVATERPTSMYARNDWAGHDMVAATNGDFYTTANGASGISRMGLIGNNECIFNPTGTSLFVVDSKGTPWVDYVNFSGSVTNAAGASTRIHTVNQLSLEWEPATAADQMSLFTPAFGSKLHQWTTGGNIAVLRPVEGTASFPVNTSITMVVDSVAPNGGTPDIPANAAVLSGVGSSADFIAGLAPGQTVTLNLGASMPSYPAVTDIREGMGGSNHIILRNGEICNINNPDLHPRTFMGISQDRTTIYSVVIDGRYAGSAGINLDDQGRVLQWLGAWEGMNLDGGGSSCMVVNGSIRNHGSDGSERAVGNGVLYYSLAPEDSEIASIAFEPINYKLPSSTRIRPAFFGYNRYGLLKSHDVADVVMSCDPEIGRIDSEGRFIATSTAAEGNIYATLGSMTATQHVVIVPAAASFVYPSCVIDNRDDYDIALKATMGNSTFTVDPASIEWNVDRPDVLSVIDGKLHAITTGVATVTGSGNGFEGSLVVNCEFVDGVSRPWQAPFVAESWTVKQTGGTGISATPLDEGMQLSFTGNAVSRNANITLSPKDGLTSYGLPVGIEMDINPGDVNITGITIAWSNATGAHGNWNICTDAMPLAKNADNALAASFSDIMDITSNTAYPVRFSSIRFTTGANEKGKAFTIAMPRLAFTYPDNDGVESITSSDRTSAPAISYANGVITTTDSSLYGETVAVYDLTGVKRHRSQLTATGSQCRLNPGIYIATVGGRATRFIAR